MPDVVVAKARVQVTLEVTLDDHWGWDAQVSQVHKQARELAIEKVKRLIIKCDANTKIVGEPSVTMVLAEQYPR